MVVLGHESCSPKSTLGLTSANSMATPYSGYINTNRVDQATRVSEKPGLVPRNLDFQINPLFVDITILSL